VPFPSACNTGRNKRNKNNKRKNHHSSSSSHALRAAQWVTICAPGVAASPLPVPRTLSLPFPLPLSLLLLLFPLFLLLYSLLPPPPSSKGGIPPSPLRQIRVKGPPFEMGSQIGAQVADLIHRRIEGAPQLRGAMLPFSRTPEGRTLCHASALRSGESLPCRGISIIHSISFDSTNVVLIVIQKHYLSFLRDSLRPPPLFFFFFFGSSGSRSQFPLFWEELQGMAHGSGVPFPEVRWRCTAPQPGTPPSSLAHPLPAWHTTAQPGTSPPALRPTSQPGTLPPVHWSTRHCTVQCTTVHSSADSGHGSVGTCAAPAIKPQNGAPPLSAPHTHTLLYPPHPPYPPKLPQPRNRMTTAPDVAVVTERCGPHCAQRGCGRVAARKLVSPPDACI